MLMIGASSLESTTDPPTPRRSRMPRRNAIVRRKRGCRVAHRSRTLQELEQYFLENVATNSSSSMQSDEVSQSTLGSSALTASSTSTTQHIETKKEAAPSLEEKGECMPLRDLAMLLANHLSTAQQQKGLFHSEPFLRSSESPKKEKRRTFSMAA